MSITTPDPNEPVTLHSGGLTITLSIPQLLAELDRTGRYRGYNPDTDEDMYEPSSMEGELIAATSLHLVKAMRREVHDLVSQQVADTIREEVTEIVRQHIVGTEVTETDEFGTSKGQPPVPLTQMIVTAAKAMNQPTGYGRNPSPMQKLVEEAVGNAFRKELAGAVAAAKATALQAVQDNAAQVIRETIERSARAL